MPLVISRDLGQQIINYLATRPYGEVHGMIAGLVNASQESMPCTSPGAAAPPDNGALKETLVAEKT